MVELLRRLRSVPDRLLHTSRRRAARLSLAARLPTRVLIVCNGNIFRSPFAAAVLRRALGTPDIRVDSAGFIGPGRPAPPDAVAAAAKHGIELSTHRAQLVTAELVRASDLIVVMDAIQRRIICERFGRARRDVVLLGDLDPERVTSRAIEDPVEQGVDVCERVYVRIERCAGELVRVLGRLRSERRA